MPATLKKPMKAKTPKKPTSKSKTGNSACSQAASNWQLAIRGKEALSPDTYTTLAKCRAMSRTAKQANLNEASGKLSTQGKQAIEGRLQKRFDAGLITQKSRDARLKELLAARSAKQAAQVKPVEAKANFNPDRIDRFAKSDRFLNNPGLIKDFVDKKGNLKRDKLINSRKETAAFWRDARKQKEILKAEEAKNKQADEQAKIKREKWIESAKGYKAKQDKNVGIVKDFIVNREGYAVIPARGNTRMFSKPQHASQILGTDEYGNIQYRTGSRVETIPGTELNAIFVKPARKDLAQRKWAERKARQQSPPPAQPTPAKAQRAGKQGVATAPKMQITKARLAPSNTLPRGLTQPERTLSQSKTMVSRVKAKQLAKTQANSGVTTLKTGNIKVDPERFQYKLNTGSSGVTDQFQDTRVWNKELAGVVQVWKDPANNQTYVVNGHHRFELAQRLGVNKLNVQYIQAKDAAEARQKGALTNIAEGRGTSIDAAKFLRDSRIDNPEQVFQSRGISLSEKTASEGLALRNLAKPIWSKVINEQTPVSRAVAIGKSGLREEDQIGLFNKAEKGQWTASKTLEFGKELKRAPLVKTSSGNLFGDDEFINTAEQRASLAERFRTRMKTDLNLFGKVARSRNAGRLEQVGQNKIDVQSSQVQAKQADQALQMFDIERNYGLVSRTLDRYATRIAGGTKLDKVYPDFERQVSKQLDNAINKEERQKLAAAKWQQRKMRSR